MAGSARGSVGLGWSGEGRRGKRQTALGPEHAGPQGRVGAVDLTLNELGATLGF